MAIIDPNKPRPEPRGVNIPSLPNETFEDWYARIKGVENPVDITLAQKMWAFRTNQDMSRQRRPSPSGQPAPRPIPVFPKTPTTGGALPIDATKWQGMSPYQQANYVFNPNTGMYDFVGKYLQTSPQQPSFRQIAPNLGEVTISPQPLPQTTQQPVQRGVNPIYSKIKSLYEPLPQIEQTAMRRIFRILPLKRRTSF